MVAPLHRAQVAQGTLAFPDLYVVLQAPEAELRRLPDVVRAAVAERPPGAPDSGRLLDAMVAWAARSAPAWHATRSTDR